MKNGAWFKRTLVLLILAVWALPAMAAEGISYRLNSDSYWKSYVDDGAYLVTAPSRWDANDWYKAGAVLGVTAGIYSFDLKLKNFVQQNRSDATDNIASVFNRAGEELFVLPGLALWLAYGASYDDVRIQKTALLSYQSWFYSFVITQGLQQAVHRYHPIVGYYYSVEGAMFSDQSVSFPSSHASTAFSVASVIASEYDESPYIPAIAYGVATLSGLSSINDNHNWSSDVFFGAATGYFIGSALVKKHEKDSPTKITIIPVINSKNPYILVEIAF
jgi:membrane-associated phospholipid phosphatase